MHTDFLVTDGAKMSKSGGGIHALEDLALHGAHPMDFRFMCLGTRYRKQLAFSSEALADAKEAHRSLRRRVDALVRRAATEQDHAVQATEAPEAPQAPEREASAPEAAAQVRSHAARFLEALLDDLNAPNALTVLHAVLRDETLSAARRISLIGQFDQVLGLGLTATLSGAVPMASDAQPEPGDADRLDDEDHRLLALRDRARTERNWAESDRLRLLLLARGIAVTDGKGGSSWTRVGP